MRPVAILQHEPHQGPGHLQRFLAQHDIPVRLWRPDLGEPVPRHAGDFSGIVVLGSDHSVHDPLRWIEDERQLLRQALARGVPVLGHCFGAQQLARACGARVVRNAWPHIGWSRLRVAPQARALFGGQTHAPAFNWHYDTFEIPRGAQRTLLGAHCLNKGFALGPHLGFQCHLEVTEESVRAWCRTGRGELRTAQGPAVQSEAGMLENLAQRAAHLHHVADGVYHQWSLGLDRPLWMRLHHAR